MRQDKDFFDNPILAGICMGLGGLLISCLLKVIFS